MAGAQQAPAEHNRLILAEFSRFRGREVNTTGDARLVEGSGLRFEERGRHMVKGLERPIEVFVLAT